MKARAIVFTKMGRAEFQKITVPAPGPDEVLIRSAFSGVSVGTDGWVFTNQFRWNGEVPYPVVPGYQRTGYVEAWGENVQGLSKGQLVAATSARLEGTPASCWAGHIELACTAKEEVYPLSAEVSPAHGAQFVVAQVGYNAADKAAAAAGETVVVLGDGGIGQMAAQAARARGARVILAGHRPERLELARQYSCDETLQTRDKGWLACFQDAGPSAVIDTVQTEPFFAEYFPHLPYGIRVVLAGFSPGGFHVDMVELQKREVALLPICNAHRGRCEKTLALMRNKQLDAECLLTHLPPAEEAARTFRMILEKSEPFLSVNFRWD